MVFYEAPHKLPGTLRDLAEALGDRRIALARELTKIHEEVIRTTLKQAADQYQDGGAKGEFVLIVEGAPQTGQSQAFLLSDAVKTARDLMAGGMSAAEAAKLAAKESGLKKSDIYREISR